MSPWNFHGPDGSLITLEPDAAVVTLSAPEAQLQAALLGLGIAQVGVHHALSHLQSGQLKTLLFGQHDTGSYEMVIQYPHRALVAPRVKATVEYLLETFRQDSRLHFPVARLAEFVA